MSLQHGLVPELISGPDDDGKRSGVWGPNSDRVSCNEGAPGSKPNRLRVRRSGRTGSRSHPATPVPCVLTVTRMPTTGAACLKSGIPHGSTCCRTAARSDGSRCAPNGRGHNRPGLGQLHGCRQKAGSCKRLRRNCPHHEGWARSDPARSRESRSAFRLACGFPEEFDVHSRDRRNSVHTWTPELPGLFHRVVQPHIDTIG